MSLFLKIFLWFWLAMALIVGAVILVNWSTNTEPLRRQFRSFVGESISLNSQTAAQIFENEGLDGLEEYFERQTNRRRINSVGFFDKDRKLVAGDIEFAKIDALFERTLESDEVQFNRLKDRTYAAKKIVLEDGLAYIYTVELRRFRAPPFVTRRLLLPALAVILMGGLVCYGLARYLSAPISKLRDATQRFASGDLKTRVGVGGGDELANLAKDFDEMAERIEALITSEKRLTQDISHELRSPLARMNVALELARQKANKETIPMIARLEAESGMLNNLISQLLTLSKLETGSQSFEKMEVNIGKLVERIVADADFEAKARGKSVKISENAEAKVFGNEHLIRSAIENVLRNAVRYTRDETTVDVGVEKAEGKVAIQIKDFGDGVPGDELNKLFKPFYRVETARDRKSGGTGLGLAIAERAVSSHNGQIFAVNKDNGLLVEIVLPTI